MKIKMEIPARLFNDNNVEDERKMWRRTSTTMTIGVQGAIAITTRGGWGELN